MNQNRVRDTASLHPATVTAISQGAVKRRRSYTRSALHGGSYQIKVDAEVWRTAMGLAGGDRTRIEVRSATEVVVHNQSKKELR